MRLVHVFSLSLVGPVFSSPLSLPTSQSLDVAPKSSLNATINNPDCFLPTRIPPFISTTRVECELALDRFVRGQSLSTPLTFSRNPRVPAEAVLLPVQIESNSCHFFMDVLNANDEDTLTRAEIYAEMTGPDGVIQNCLGQVRMPAIGGRMTLGPKRVLKAIVTGIELGAGGGS